MYTIKLSPYHTIFYNEWKLDPYGSRYNIVFDQVLSGNLDISRLECALYRFAADCLIINSHVTQIEDELYWTKNTEIPKLEYFKSPHTREQISNYVSMPFEIETKALYRIALFTEADGNFRFILVLHHLLIDGGSFNILISEISNYYNSPTYKLAYTLPQQEHMLIDTAKLLEKQLEKFDSVYQDFWGEYLNNIEPVDLRWVKSESDISNIKEYRFNLTQETTEKLISTTKKFGITAYIYSKCIFAILLHKYTGQNKISLSYPIAIKGGIPLIAGAQVNTNINIYELSATTRVIDLFKQDQDFIQLIRSKGQNASHYPINKIMHTANNDLLAIMFAQTNLKDMPFDFINAQTLKINSEFNIDLPVKIIFELEMLENILNFRVRYHTLKIDSGILEKFTSHYKKIFSTILNDLNSNITNKTIGEYSVLSKLEYNQIVYEWNKTTGRYKSNKTISELFEAQVTKTPNNLAVVYENIQLTYVELNVLSNQLAHYLIANYNINRDDLIALYLDRSQYMLIAILGILKAGAAYVPIDPSYPEKRIRYILKDTKAKVLITNNCYYDSISAKSTFSDYTNILAIDSDNARYKLKQQPENNLKSNITSRDLVYVMYTSGTTGDPKGVMIEHYSATIRILSMIKKSGINSTDKYLFKTNYTFDVSFSDIFMTLLSGAALYITKSSFDVDEINSLITKNNINICHFVPAQLEIMHNYPKKESVFCKLKIINVSGEKFKKSLIDKNNNIKYINYYGPTEAGEVSYDITDFKNHLMSHGKLATIGYPLDKSTLYVLDNDLKPMPIGAIGELHIGGAGLARGYLNSPQLTAEKFIPNPFQTKEEKQVNENSRLYKTGDLVRYLSDGNIECIGRKDNQIKKNGLRIELSEIETKLSNYPGIKQAVVLYQEQTDITGRNRHYLVAYYLSNNKLDENLILEYLAMELPEYMVPDITVWLQQLPLTGNGKLDIKSLPQVHFVANTNDYVAPRNESEQRICAIYAEVLGLPIDEIGINTSFFKMGGNSISAIRLLFKLQYYFNIILNNIFELKTPAKLAQFVPTVTVNLEDKLEAVKSIYLQLELDKEANNIAIEHERIPYHLQAKSFTFENEIRSTCKILLTGATGYLGCHVLQQLLMETNHTIYLLIRVAEPDGSNIAAYQRITNKFKYYFGINLDNYKHRLIFLKSDIEQVHLGLDELIYQNLVDNIDSIIHCAALVKHYGEYIDFYRANVQSTINLLELAKTTRKDFHYVSTIGVFINSRLSEKGYNIFTENSIDNAHANLDNIYTKTKYEGEQATLKYREYGVRTNIYRIGNIAINSVTHKAQENIEDNAFFQCVKTILELGIISKELSEVDISPVDYTAAAIIALFNQKKLYNQIYHVFNPEKSNLYALLCQDRKINIEKVSFYEFIDSILTKIRYSDSTNQIELFMLHQGWLQPNIKNLAKAIIFQDKTNCILNQLNIHCPNITNRMLYNLIESVKMDTCVNL